MTPRKETHLTPLASSPGKVEADSLGPFLSLRSLLKLKGKWGSLLPQPHQFLRPPPYFPLPAWQPQPLLIACSDNAVTVPLCLGTMVSPPLQTFSMPVKGGVGTFPAKDWKKRKLTSQKKAAPLRTAVSLQHPQLIYLAVPYPLSVLPPCLTLSPSSSASTSYKAGRAPQLAA